MESKEKAKESYSILQQLGRKLGRNTLIADTLVRLREKGIKVSPSMVYKVVAGGIHREDIALAYMEVAEEEISRRRELDERAQQLIAQA